MAETHAYRVGILAGSASERELLKHTEETLGKFGVPCSVETAAARELPEAIAGRVKAMEQAGCQVFVATSAGGFNLPAWVARCTEKPVLAVPVETPSLKGLDSLYAAVQQPAGIALASLAIGKAGAVNAALMAIAILANTRTELKEKLRQFRKDQQEQVLAQTL